MTNRFTRLLPVLAFLVAPSLAWSADKVMIDPLASSVTWVGRKVTGEHSGTVGLTSGEVVLEKGMIKSGVFALDIGKVVVKDIEDPAYNAKLTGHLKSPDFFSVEKFPTVEFAINEASALKTPGANGENTLVKGSLKIKGMAHAVEFPAVVTIKDGSAEAKGKVTLDRTKWDIRYGSGKFFQGLGDKLIYDEFEVSFMVSGPIVGANDKLADALH